jgi:GTPase SAR1 family protein
VKPLIDLKNLKPNIPKVDISEYTFLLYGKPKSGKTSLFYEISKDFFDGDMSKALLIALEKGYKALNNIMAVDVNNWKEFADLVDQLVEDRNELTFRLLGIDTLDVLYQYACDFIIRQERIARKDAKIKTIADIPWGAGYQLTSDLLQKTLQKLIHAGYGLFLISHNTEKKFESRDGTSYDQTTISLPTRARDIFINMADFIIFVDIEKKKEGVKLVDNRYIYFRSDGDIQAGSRFEQIPDRIEYGAKEFLEAFKTAVKSNFENEEDMKQAELEQKEKKEREVQEFIQEETRKSDIEKLMDTIAERIKNASKELKKNIKELFKENFETHDYKKFSHDQLIEALDLMEKFNEE